MKPVLKLVQIPVEPIVQDLFISQFEVWYKRTRINFIRLNKSGKYESWVTPFSKMETSRKYEILSAILRRYLESQNVKNIDKIVVSAVEDCWDLSDTLIFL